MLHAQVVAEQVIAQWVMEARRSTMATNVHWEDVVQPTEATEAGLEVSVISPLTKLNIVLTIAETSTVVLTTTELPSSSSIASSTDVAGGHNGVRVEIVSLCKR